ncbi:tetratricopeptide repeat protein [Azospirillum sp.]|uniref:tetratricopeptide repeat protein n=1 Tax=Azospirillum sp. TaxID=34012 RepID=UPI00261954BB|nr:tetratricopeptide repeat protein [Azospirillum sp.]
MASIGEALVMALDLHQAGRVGEARLLYQRILDVDPEQADAHHLLGVLCGMTGDIVGARRRIARAVALVPARPDFHGNLANILRADADKDGAGRHDAHSLTLQPDNAEAAARLGALRAAQGVTGAAGELARLVLSKTTAVSQEALTGFALALSRVDRLEDLAAALLERAAERDPASALVQANLALVRQRQGRVAQATDHFRQALERDPQFALVWDALGQIRADSGRLAEAAALFQRQAALRPDDPAPFRRLGDIARRRGQSGAAERALLWAETLEPGDRDSGLTLAVLLLAGKKAAAAEQRLTALARRVPDDPVILYNLAQTLIEQSDRDGALALLRRVAALAPDLGDPLHSLGALLTGLGFARLGSAWLERALRFGADRANWHRAAMLSILYVPGVDADRRFALHRRLEAAFPPLAPPLPFANRLDPDRRLRIGYLTSDLRAFQPIGRNLLPLFENRDREGFEVIVYAHVLEPDATTERFRALSDGWRDITGQDDSTVAARMRADGVDILVPLGIRFDNNRPHICHLRPAPVQISLHDAATSGLSAIDYLITDRTMTPRHGAERFTERPLRLPSFYVAGIPADAPPPGPLPMLADGVIRFGCFNNPAKISNETLRLWAKLMARIPQARLVLKYLDSYRSDLCVRRIRAALSAGGVDPSRLWADPAEAERPATHLARYSGIDIALDPFPFCGSTTTFEALVMGVPVITLPGDTMVSRWSASMLRALRLDGLVASCEDDYVTIAEALASDPARLSDLRATLRDRLAASPLCDGRRRARQVERLYRAVWRRFCHERTQAGA